MFIILLSTLIFPCACIFINLFVIVMITGSSGLPLGTQAPTTVPGSTATTTIAPIPATHSSLPQQLAPPNGYHVAQALATPITEPPNAAANVLPGNAVSPSQPAKVKKGVKRKAEPITPITPTTYDPHFTTTPVDAKSAKISTRRESGRQIKKPTRPEMDGLVPYHQSCITPIMNTPVNSSQPSHSAHGKNKEKLSEALKSCNEILKELFCKKHSVRNFIWYQIAIKMTCIEYVSYICY